VREIGSILGGIGLLIFAYLILANATAAGNVANSISSSGASLITALQGRGGTG
jgi:hypothetical protein